jgi:predicted AlkP superfamily phosphohydrolase/phosphomutase
MANRLLIIGLDCLGDTVLRLPDMDHFPTLTSLARKGMSGTLRSTIPPITVPAWTSMFASRDPGELGIYGFRNRDRSDYSAMSRADSRSVLYPRLWDYVTAAGNSSIVVGVPQTYPPPHLKGVLISGFDTPAEIEDAVYPASYAGVVRRVAADYAFDVEEFRNAERNEIRRKIETMTSARFAVMRELMGSEPWRLAVFCEIGVDRMHHCFWSDHDNLHPLHDPESLHRDAIAAYYKLLDREIAQLVRMIDPDDYVMVVSDHGAKTMLGGFCINEWLIANGWLVLKDIPNGVSELSPSMIDWNKTKAWAHGGYYARIFLNEKSREPKGIVPPEQREAILHSLIEQLSCVTIADGRVIKNEIVQPEKIYRKVRGFAPDLMVFFDDLHMRSIGSVGHGSISIVGNDTGLDHANHSYEGVYVLAGPNVASARSNAEIYDVLPTALVALKLKVPADLKGSSLIVSHSQIS